MKTALTIAGSDCSGGAGIQYRFKDDDRQWSIWNECDHGADNTEHNRRPGDFEITPEFLEQQIDSVFTDIRPDAVKIGMVSSTGLIKSIAKKLW